MRVQRSRKFRRRALKNDLEELDILSSLDEMFMLMMRFTKKQLLGESIHGTVITPPQFGLLMHCQCGPKTMKTLSEQMGLTHGAITGLVDRLHKLGLVDRQRSEEDRRVVHVLVTAEGQELIQRINDRRHDILRKILRQLSADERKFMLKIHTFVKDKLINYVE